MGLGMGSRDDGAGQNDEKVALYAASNAVDFLQANRT